MLYFAPVEFREFRRELQNFHNTELLNVPKLKHLLQNGRKSLATVRDVQYRAKSEKQYPEFVLRYAFNPVSYTHLTLPTILLV